MNIEGGIPILRHFTGLALIYPAYGSVTHWTINYDHCRCASKLIEADYLEQLAQMVLFTVWLTTQALPLYVHLKQIEVLCLVGKADCGLETGLEYGLSGLGTN